MEDVNNHKIHICASHWPTFMYNFTEKYNPNNMDLGLCHGLILICISVHHYFDQIVDGITGFLTHLHRTIISAWDTLSGDKGPKGNDVWPYHSDWQDHRVCCGLGVSHTCPSSFQVLLISL